MPGWKLPHQYQQLWPPGKLGMIKTCDAKIEKRDEKNLLKTCKMQKKARKKYEKKTTKDGEKKVEKK